MEVSLNTFKSYYDVGGEKFANIFQAFNRSIESKNFCYYKIDNDWIKHIESYSVNKKPTVDTLHNLYAEKLKKLRNKFNKIVLAYSGGTDSNTILNIAIKNKIYIDEVYIMFPGVIELSNDSVVNREQILAVDCSKKYLNKSIGSIKIIKWQKDDYNYLKNDKWWEDPLIWQHNKIKVLPCWAAYGSQLYKDLDGIVITGHEKPGIRIQDKKLYWYVTDTSTTEHQIMKNSIPFFLDPEISLNYAFLLKDLIKNKTNYFTKIENRFDFFWKIPLQESKKFYKSLGYIFISKDAVNFTQKPDWGTHHNYKNQANLKILQKTDNKKIYNRLIECHKKIYDTYKDYPYMVETDGVLMKTVERYSQMFEITDNSFICKGHDI